MIKVATAEQMNHLAEEIENADTGAASTDRFGNFVVQKCVERMTPVAMPPEDYDQKLLRTLVGRGDEQERDWIWRILKTAKTCLGEEEKRIVIDLPDHWPACTEEMDEDNRGKSRKKVHEQYMEGLQNETGRHLRSQGCRQPAAPRS